MNHNRSLLLSPPLFSVQYKQPHYWKQQIFLAKQFPQQAGSLIALDVLSQRHVGFLKKWFEIRSLIPCCFFNFLPQSSCAEKEPESIIAVIILPHDLAESSGKIRSQSQLSVPELSASRPYGLTDSCCCIWDLCWPLASGLITEWAERDTEARLELRLLLVIQSYHDQTPISTWGWGLVMVKVSGRLHIGYLFESGVHPLCHISKGKTVTAELLGLMNITEGSVTDEIH